MCLKDGFFGTFWMNSQKINATEDTKIEAWRRGLLGNMGVHHETHPDAEV